MPATVPRSHWIDDDGSGTTGTVINDAEKQKLYNDIDAGLGAVTLTTIAPGGIATLSAPSPMINLVDTSAPTNQKIFRLYNLSQQFVVDTTDDAITVIQTTPLIVSRSGNLKVFADLYEKQRTTPMGHWQAVPFNASNFTATGGGTWTVTAGNVTTFQYAQIGKTVLINLSLANTVLTGSANTLIIQIPVSLAPSGNSLITYVANGAQGMGYHAYTNAAQLVLYKDALGTLWTAANPFHVYAALALPLT